MTINQWNDERLNRLASAVEANLIAMTELRQLIDSNARSNQANTDNIARLSEAVNTNKEDIGELTESIRELREVVESNAKSNQANSDNVADLQTALTSLANTVQRFAIQVDDRLTELEDE